MKTFLREALITIILAVVIFLAARATIQTNEVRMSSMEPNFHEKQRLVVNKAIYWFGDPERGDVIVFEDPNGSKEDFIKRVIAIPGDTVEMKDQAVYVNGVRLDEPYIKDPFKGTMKAVEIPEGKYFVLGDNRNHSNDSQDGWFAEREDIQGKAWLSTWPPADWGVMPDYDLGEQLVTTETQ